MVWGSHHMKEKWEGEWEGKVGGRTGRMTTKGDI